ncbi:hypothetical protein ACGFZL_03465 [Streptomyces sp. NPDC048182]|uniref:hypothetical protein n=1 Tax=Streptomyces sp. NPDC048182 TaxID=3365507 RepID=UPI00371C7234
MESGPAVFAGMTFVLFGTGLLTWTAACVRHGRPVAYGVGPVASAAIAGAFAVAALAAGTWCLTQV